MLHVEKAVCCATMPWPCVARSCESASGSAGAWHACAALFAQTQSPDFLRATSIPTICVMPRPANICGFAAWDRVEGALIQHVLSGPLFWLG
jgi:hypothetical protein